MGDDEGALLRLWRGSVARWSPRDLSANLIVQFGTATEHLNRHWYERSSARCRARCFIRSNGGWRPPSTAWSRHGRGVRGQVHAAMVVLGGRRQPRKHMAQLQHNMWVTVSRTAVLSIITGGGKMGGD